MNPQNYASLKASKRLVDAGIVMETEAYWIFRLSPGAVPFLGIPEGNEIDDSIPAPSMAEAWRELPPGTELRKAHSYTEAFLFSDTENADSIFPPCNSLTNPTDALIDLLIWVRKEKI